MEMSYEDKDFSTIVSNSRLIDRGAFGAVYGPCDWKGKTCAVKMESIRNDAEKQHSAFCQMMTLQHKNLITVYDVSVEPRDVYILMEYAGGGSLKKFLFSCKSDLPLEIMKDWGSQIAEGMAYLHEKNIVHRDLKSANIVIMESDASSNPYEKTLKITDFDQIREHHGTQTMSFEGTCAYMAPEVANGQWFSKASDVWSYGIVLWELITRKVPYEGVSGPAIIARVQQGQVELTIPDSSPNIINVVMKRCLRTLRGRRPPFIELLTMLQSNVGCPSSINFIQKITGETEDVFGVTKLKNEIYILCQSKLSPNVICVYEDICPFGLQMKIEIKETKYPVDIGSDEKENCLYVSDYKAKCIWKVTRDTIVPDGKHISKWLSTAYEPHTISVSSDGRLLVVDMYRSILHIYNSDKEPIQSIVLQRDIENTRHAVETPDGNFIIIHQCVEMEEEEDSSSSGRESRPKWVISEVAKDGKMKRSFNPSNKTEELLDPKHLSLDADDRVFVVDKDNHRVVLLDSLLRWKRSLCPTKEVNETIVQWPRRLFYNEAKKQLIVGGQGATVYCLS